MTSVVLSGLIACAGCNPFAPDQTVVLSVSGLEAPATVAAGNTISVVLSVDVNGCERFDRITVNRNVSGATLTAWGTDGSKGSKGVTCPEILKLESHTVQILPPFTDPFTITVPRGRLSPLTASVKTQ
jgi:hypothetical protein